MAIDFKAGVVEMAHGGGGRATANLIDELFIPAFSNPFLNEKNDQARLSLPTGNIVMATDSHVISPLFFPGGDIGSLSVYGTVNDIAVSGATPLYMSCGFILEEGLPLAKLQTIVQSMASAASHCNIQIVTGDTKVVERGHGDGIYINTTGIGSLPGGTDIGPHKIAPGDHILINGTLGDHGATIMMTREGNKMHGELTSDCASLSSLIHAMLAIVPEVHCMRDPTRGGVAATLNELAQTTGFDMRVDEPSLPVKGTVSAMTELLGIDPLFLANEGKVLAFCPPHLSEKLLSVMKQHFNGKDAAIIGTVLSSTNKMVSVKTAFGGERRLEWRYNDPLPRIC